MMKYPILFVLLIFAPSIVVAHPVDDLCAPGLHTEDGCQPVVQSLALDNPEFFKAHKAYWHCRRQLVSDDLMRLAQCVGLIKGESKLLGEFYTPTVAEEALCDYWNVIPAHPELDALDSGDIQKNVDRSNAQLGACELTRAITAAVIGDCEFREGFVAARLAEKLKPVPPLVCPKPTPTPRRRR